jgi:peptidoglycan/xylan/chitin deacetylase (PgdA/CDA1 family)
MSHGLYNTQYLFGLSVDEERALIQDTIETLRRHTGRQLKGMFGPAASITPNTMELMAEAGLTYTADWYLDDQPFPINVSGGRLVCVPYTWELNDGLWMTEGYGKGMGTQEADFFLQMCKDQFDVLYEEGAESGRVMCIALHTSIFGQPYRVRYLDEALDYILSHDGVWPATADEIAEHYLEHHYDGTVAHLERDGRA